MTDRMNQLTEAGVFVFFAAMFAVFSGFSYGGALLLMAGLWFLARRPVLQLTRDDWWMVWVLAVYGIVSSLMVAWLGNDLSDIDNYSRALMAIPVLLLLCHARVRLPLLWAAIVLGVVLSAPLAWWQVHVLHEGRAAGFLNVIHFSNLTLLFAVFCAGGLFWAAGQADPVRRRAWYLAFALGIACGLYSMALGGSRASWVAVPPAAVLFLIAFLNRRNMGRMALAGVLAVVLVAGLFAMPGSPLRARYDQGAHDISQYERDNADTSIGARFTMWQGAWANLKQKPVLGWNLEDYRQALERRVAAGELSPVALQYSDNLHNNYLQAWVFTGLPGLLVLLALYAMPLWHFARRLRDADPTVRVLAFCGTSVVVSYLCFTLTQVMLRRNNGIMFYLLAVVIFWGALRQASRGVHETLRVNPS